MIRAVVFSRDRTMQLDALLRSIDKHAAGLFRDIIVLYKATGEEFAEAYRQVEGEHHLPIFKKEANFHEDLTDILSDDGFTHVCLLTDDEVFYRDPPDWRLHDFTPQVLRLGRNTTRCYPLNKEQEFPPFEQVGDWLYWRWQGASGDFGYPFSVDAQIYPVKLLRDLLTGLTYRSPNHLEDVGVRRHLDDPHQFGRWITCPEHSCVVNIPANLVNDGYPNRHSNNPDWTAEALNTRYLAGERIDLAAMDFTDVRAAHQEIPLKFR